MRRIGTSRRELLLSGAAAVAASVMPAGAAVADAGEPQRSSGKADRAVWIGLVEQVSEPVLRALYARRLRAEMPVEAVAGQEKARAVGTHLEALGRLLAGLAPWLELDATAGEDAKETALRERYRTWALEAIRSAVDPASPDFMRFGESSQTLVDSSFLSLAMLRAPRRLIETMDAGTRRRMVEALVKQREVLPPFNNWLLFAAMNEALLRRLGAGWDKLRVEFALRELQTWYLGDGTYGDGPEFHADFYNSFVMQPYLLQLMETLGDEAPAWKEMRPAILRRAQRYAAIQERLISPSGEYPVLGRSITYRAGAFHLLADVALRRALPDGVTPAQVRGALTAVQQKTLTPRGTFSERGWLQIGLAGHQPGLGESYISTGSLYLCSVAWLPLGLPPGESFWSAEDMGWTQKKVWAGRDVPADHALHA